MFTWRDAHVGFCVFVFPPLLFFFWFCFVLSWGCVLIGLKPQTEQNECAQCIQKKLDGNYFTHLLKSFEPVGFDNYIVVYNSAKLE